MFEYLKSLDGVSIAVILWLVGVIFTGIFFPFYGNGHKIDKK